MAVIFTLFFLLVFFYSGLSVRGRALPPLLPPLVGPLPPAVSRWFGQRMVDVRREVTMICSRKQQGAQTSPNIFKHLPGRTLSSSLVHGQIPGEHRYIRGWMIPNSTWQLNVSIDPINQILVSHLQSPAHHRFCVCPVGCELEDKGSAENPSHQRPRSGPPLLHLSAEIETLTRGEEKSDEEPAFSDKHPQTALMMTSRWQ